MMSILRMRNFPRIWKLALPAAFTLFIYIMYRNVLVDALIIVGGAIIITFLIEPLARFYECRLSRNLAALCALLTIFGIVLLALYLLLPTLISECISLIHSLPQSIAIFKNWLAEIAHWLEHHLPGIELPRSMLNSPQFPVLAKETIGIAGNIADSFYRLSLMIVLGYFFLCDRDRLLIRVELFIPRFMRKNAVRMGNAVGRELKLYLRGQTIISACVGALAALGLAIIGVRSALVLGIIVGILNMIPYFGPILGGIPAVLTAFGSGAQTALLAILVLWIVQQIDSTLISPRIMSSLAGVSPATVLLAIFIGSGIGGIVGMLLAMPSVMAFRTVFRVFVQKYENV